MPPGTTGRIESINPRLVLRTRDNLVNFLSRLRNILTRNPNSLKTRLVNLIDRLLPRLRELRDGNISDSLKNLLQEFRSLVEQYRENRNGELTRTERDLINSVLAGVANLSGQERVEAAPAAQVQPTDSARNDGIIRSQVLRLVSEIKPLLLDLTQKISLPRVFEALKQQPIEQVIRDLPREITSRETKASSELLGRLILSLVVDRLLKDLVENARQVGEITRENFEKAVKQINEELKRTVVEVRTKGQDAVRRDRDLADYVDLEVSYEQGNNERDIRLNLSLSGQIREAEVVRSARELVNTRERQALPVLAESALRMIQAYPEASFDIVRFVTEVFTRANTTGDPAPVAVPSVPEKAIAGQTGITNESTNVLPVLLAEYGRLDAKSPAKAVIEQMIVEVAKTADGQKYVLNAFAAGETKALLSSEVGQQLVVQVAQAFAAEAKASRTAPKSTDASLRQVKGTEQLIEITKMVAEANAAKLTADNTSFAAARNFIETAVQAQKVVSLIKPKNLARLEKQAAKPARRPISSTRYGRKTTPRKQPVNPVRTVRSRSALRQLIKQLDQVKLALPEKLFNVIASRYAGLAGLQGLTDPKLVMPLNLTGKAEETRQNMLLRRILEIMESQITRQVSQANQVSKVARQPGKALPAVSSLSAEVMVYGLVMRRVRAEIERADELIQQLRQAGKLGRIIKLVADGQLEQAIQELDHGLYQQNPDLIALAV